MGSPKKKKRKEKYICGANCNPIFEKKADKDL